MDIDHILRTMHDHDVDYILIGGVNFLLRHLPELTYDIDIWILDTDANLEKANQALTLLRAEWGSTEQNWKPIPADPQWLRRQICFCLTTPFGALDIFREVRGLEGKYSECKIRAQHSHTPSGVTYWALSDEDMLRCQEALEPADRKTKRMEVLRAAIQRKNS